QKFNATLRVRITGAHSDFQVGDLVELTGRLYELRGRRNPGETDWARQSRLQGVHAGLSLEGPQYARVCSRVQLSRFSRFRAKLRAMASGLLHDRYAAKLTDESGSLLDTIVLGQRTKTAKSVDEAFTRAGGAHFLAVSGFHVGILIAAVWWLLRLLRASTPIVAAGITIVVILYALVAEAHAPILRAAIMASCFGFAAALRRTFSPLNWLCLAGFLILLINPFELFRAGFQLSFLQVAMLITVFPRLRRAWIPPLRDSAHLFAIASMRVWRRGADLVLICLLAWLTAWPLVAHHFGVFSLWGILGTVFLSPLIAVLICWSFATMVLGALLPFSIDLMRSVLSGLTDLTLRLVNSFAALPGTQIQVPQPPWWLVVLTYVLAFAAFRWMQQSKRPNSENDPAPTISRVRRNRRRLTAGLFLFVLTALWWAWWSGPRLARARDDTFSLVVLDVGNGSANLLVDNASNAWVVDAGTLSNTDVGESVLGAMRTMRAKALKADAISHANLDHYSGVPRILHHNPDAAKFVNPWFFEAAQNDSYLDLPDKLPPVPKPSPLSAGDQFSMSDAHVEILWPPKSTMVLDANDRSLVLRVYANGRSILIPGDIESQAMSALLAAHGAGAIDLQSDVLVAPHHGAVLPRVTAEFYSAVQPELVVASTRRAQDKLRPLCQQLFGDGTPVRLTSEAGAVTINISGNGSIQFDSELPSARD
ncbi:MAG: ComEC/Rec2 family competence protein, partial [Phycisphaerae bacterium]